MGPINTLPLGFLDLLGLQAQGRNLGVVSDALSPTIDTFPFYAAYKRTFVRNDVAFAAAATSSLTVATVPVGEYWYMIGGLMQNGSAGGSTGFAHIEITVEGRVVFVSDTISAATAQLNQAIPINFQTTVPLVLSPGSIINKFGYGLAGAGAELVLARLGYLPLRG
jgi:hypothetical protein